MTTLMVVVFWTASAAPGLAQAQAVVVPQSAASVDGNRWMNSHFREQDPRRIQILIAARHLVGLQGKRLSQLAFRKDVKTAERYSVLRGGESTAMRVLASFSDADPAKPALSFAANHGPTVVEVFRGAVTMPRVSVEEDRAVATFDPSEAPTLSFNQALPHENAKTLVLEFLISGGKDGHAWSWPVDAVTAFQPGTVEPYGSTCWPAQAQDAIRVVRGSLRPGMHLKTESVAPPESVVAFHVFGVSDKLAYGSVPLPLRIGAPNCDLLVSPDVMVPTIFFRGPDGRHDGWSATEVALPSNPGLYGATLYFQYLYLQAQGNSFGLRSTNAVKATLTKLPPSLGVSLVASMDLLASQGRVFLDFTPVLQIEGR